MRIEKIPVERLKAAAYNPRKDLKPEDAEYQKLQRSIEEFGYVEPVIWNKRTGNVVGGHQRLKILLTAGEREVECSVVDLPLAEEKALNVALNKISGDWDEEALSKLLQELSADNSIDVSLTGFDTAELDNLINQLGAKIGTSPGDVDNYVDGFFEDGDQSKDSQSEEGQDTNSGDQDEGENSLICVITVRMETVEERNELAEFLEENGYDFDMEDVK